MVDPVAAIIQRLKATPAVVQAVGQADWISDQRPADAEPNRRHVAVLSAGGLGNHPDLPLNTRRVDIFCYGETAYAANLVAGAVYAALIPPSRRTAFVAAGVRVYHIAEVGGLTDLVDEGWPMSWGRFEVAFYEVPQGA